MLNQSNKIFNQKGKMGEMPNMMRNMPQNMRALNSVFGPHMLRKFPPQTMFVKPNMQQGMQGMQGMNMNMQGMNQMGYPQGMNNMNPMMFQQGQNFQPMHLEGLDKNARRDFYGEKLYTKISSNPQFAQMNEHFSKIVGIFLDLDDPVIERLIMDDTYFGQQVFETVRLLSEKTGNN